MYRTEAVLPALPVCFVHVVPQARTAVVGALLPSRDAVGRVFPFAVFLPVDAGQLARRLPARPARLLRCFLGEVARLGARRGDARRPGGARAYPCSCPCPGPRSGTSPTSSPSGSSISRRDGLSTRSAGRPRGRPTGSAPSSPPAPPKRRSSRHGPGWCWSARWPVRVRRCGSSSPRRVLRWRSPPPFLWTEAAPPRLLLSLGAPPPSLLGLLARADSRLSASSGRSGPPSRPPPTRALAGAHRRAAGGGGLIRLIPPTASFPRSSRADPP